MNLIIEYNLINYRLYMIYLILVCILYIKISLYNNKNIKII